MGNPRETEELPGVVPVNTEVLAEEPEVSMDISNGCATPKPVAAKGPETDHRNDGTTNVGVTVTDRSPEEKLTPENLSNGFARTPGSELSTAMSHKRASTTPLALLDTTGHQRLRYVGYTTFGPSSYGCRYRGALP